MSDPPSESKLSDESQDELLKYSTGSSPSGDDTVVRIASSVSPENKPDSQVAAPVARIRELSAISDDLTPSEVRYRLFPIESGHPATAPLPETIGLQLDHFRLEERIGTGGMGAVFRATDERLQRVVAIKVLSPSQLHQPDAITRFENEARSAARLDHENIARVYTVSKDKGVHFIAYEYVIGPNVRDIIQTQGRLDVSVAVNYTIQIARALNHTSAAGVVHRDIKPSNIIITPEGRAKLVDLGLARNESTETSDDLTVAGTTLGTFDYIAPEQAKDPRNVDVRSDIYSLGCTLYHMLTGTPPYPEGTVLQKLLDHQARETPDPAEINPLVSPMLSQVINKMMASNPLERYFTPDSLIRDLIEIAASMGISGHTPRALGKPRAEHIKRIRWESYIGWMVAGLILIVVVMGLDFFSSQYPTTPDRRSLDTTLNNSVLPPTVVTPQKETDPNPANTDKKVESQVSTEETKKPQSKPVTDPAPSPKRNLFHIDAVQSELQSLNAAIQAAVSGDVIDISPAESTTITLNKPLVLEDTSLTIRGAANSPTRPVLHVELPQRDSERTNAMFSIQNGGTLSLINVDIHLSVPDEFVVEEDFIPTLFLLSGHASSLSLTGVSVTLECSASQIATVFHFAEPNESTLDSIASTNGQPVVLKLDECFIRSDSRIFELNSLHPTQLNLEDSVLAADNSVLHVSGGQGVTDELPLFQMKINYSTIQSDVSFIQVTNNFNKTMKLPQMVVSSQDNIFTTRNNSFSFEDILDFNQSQNFDDLLSWKGDHNYFNGIYYYRRIRPYDGEPEIQDQYAKWQAYWQKHISGSSHSSEVKRIWLTPTNSLPSSKLTLDDFELNRNSENNPVVNGSLDGQTDAGAPIQELKELEFQLNPVLNEPTTFSLPDRQRFRRRL